MNLCILFGGKSTEHDISLISASNILYYINKNKYNIYPVYISKSGEFYKYTEKNYKIFELGEKPTKLKKIKNVFNYLKKMDVVFPVLHGKYGEDGTIEGMLEILNIPYVGPKVLASSLCMDKIMTKIILEHSFINVSKYMWLKRSDFENIDKDKLIKDVKKKLKYPVFVKPSNSGSSIGVHKCNDKELISSLVDAFKYDEKVLIEEEIKGRELECAIIGNNDLIISEVGEIIKDDFYSFNEKYKNDKENVIIPANLDNKLKEKIKEIAKTAYYVCNLKGMARIDFFVEKNGRIIINEINTIPGFTNISMFPKLFKEVGISYDELIDKLIEYAKEEI